MHQGTVENSDGTTCITSISTPSVTVASFPQVLDRYKYKSPCYNRITITVTALWVATPFLSTISVAAVCVAVSTNQWLLTQENIKNENYTGRGDQEYFPKNTVSGLWTLCYTKPGKQGFFCSNIEYFPREEYSPDLKDSTMAIPYTVTKSAAFLILSTFLLFLGEFCCLCGHFSRQRRLFIFISGVIFIISGLLMLIGLVMYISIFKAEVGGKLRPTSQLQPAVFTYKYGYSFILFVTGFVITEISGTCAVFLYIYWHQKEWKKKGYDLRSKLVSPTFHNVEHLNNFYPYCRQHSQYLSPNRTGCSSSEIVSENYVPLLQRRLYLDHRSDTNSENAYSTPICLRHSISCAISNELISDVKKQNSKVGSIDINDDCPSSPSDVCHQHVPSTCGYEFVSQNFFPQDASTNTVLNWEDAETYDDSSSSVTHEHDFVPFDLEENTKVVPLVSNHTAFGKCIQKEVIYETLSKTTFV